MPDAGTTASNPRAGGSTVQVDRDLLIKRQSPERSRLERVRAQFGARVASECGLFEVPEIISHDDASGEIAFRFVSDSVPLRALFIDRTDPELPKRAGRALAAIHDAGADATGSEVSWHGDYGLENILYSETRDRLTIVDWSNAAWALQPAERARGNPGLDLGIALVSLFHDRILGPANISKPGTLGSAMLRAYVHERDHFSGAAVYQFIVQLIHHRHRYWNAQRGAFRAMAYYPSLIRLRLFLSNIRSLLEQE